MTYRSKDGTQAMTDSQEQRVAAAQDAAKRILAGMEILDDEMRDLLAAAFPEYFTDLTDIGDSQEQTVKGLIPGNEGPTFTLACKLICREVCAYKGEPACMDIHAEQGTEWMPCEVCEPAGALYADAIDANQASQARIGRLREALEQARREWGAFFTISGETIVQIDAALEATDSEEG